MFRRLLSTTTLVLAVWIAVKTAVAQPKPGNYSSCKNGGVAGTRRHPICTCKSGFKGYDCSQRVRPCEARPCRNGGKCQSISDGTFSCTCPPTYKGVLCEQKVRPCDSGPCKNGGNCSDDGIKCFKCECRSGFKGPDCSEIVQPCEIKPCKNNGACVNEEGGKFTCKCKVGFGGTFCDKRDGLYGSKILNQQQKYIGQLEKWLGGAKSWKLCYRASDHGWAASAFHSRCDNKRPTVTIIRVGVKPYIFGAYSDVAFGGSTGYRASTSGFIFSLVNKDGIPPFKSPGTGYSGKHAIYTRADYGPTFGGGHDIHISNNANAGTSSYSNFGYTYKVPSGYTYNTVKVKNLLAGSYNFKPNEVETFYLHYFLL